MNNARPSAGPHRAPRAIWGQSDSFDARSYMTRLFWKSRPETPKAAPSTSERSKTMPEPVSGQYVTARGGSE